MPRIPDFTAVGFDDPKITTPIPTYPASDPVAAGEAALGKGLETAGSAALQIAATQEAKRQALNEANATTDFFNRYVPTHTSVALATSPEQVTERRKQYDGMLETSANAIDDPQRRALFIARHSNAILHAQGEADEKLQHINLKNYGVSLETQLDNLFENATKSPDPRALDIANLAGRQVIDAADGSGLDPQFVYQLKKHFQTKMESTAQVALVDAGVAWAQGVGPEPRGGSVSVGGAVPKRIAETAAANNVDPTLALTTAQIESSMGRNLGSRGNIFQLGNSEWAAVGGGNKGDPDTDIKNGVAWLGRTQRQVEDALGRKPQPWEVYLAHQQGVAGAAKLLSNPDAPAGTLLPPHNISSNGGDPNAPAADFVAHWRDRFTQVASNVSGAASGATSGDNLVAFGDSIAAHLIRSAGVNGQEDRTRVGSYRPGDTAVSGYDPVKVLKVISDAPDEAVRGKNIILSTGTSNDPENKWSGSIPAQIAVLRSKGAASVTVMGVGTKYADRNDQLAQIANDNGAAFSGPLRNVASDGIHSSDPRAELAAVRAAAPASENIVLANQDAQPNRTGLPPLAEQYRRIDALAVPQAAKDHMKTRATTQYNAMEADAARSERVAAGLEKQRVEDRTNQIYADVYSGSPQITAQQIAVDPAFNSHPERRKQMIELINDPPGSKVPASQSYAAAQSMIDRIRLPDGDPNKITDVGQIYDSMRQLNRPDFEFVKKEFDQIRTPGGEIFAKRKGDFVKLLAPQIDKSNPLMGKIDQTGKSQLYSFEWALDEKIDEYRKAGKNPADLLNPSKPDYMGRPEALAPFLKTMQQSLSTIREQVRGVTGQPTPVPAPAATAVIPPAVVARQPGESPGDYLKRIGAAPPGSR